MEEIYFDNAATSQPSAMVIEKMTQVLSKDYGNPSSLHLKGLEAERHIRNTSQILSSLLKVGEDEIIYTSGGTESNNLAIIGIAQSYHRRGKHIITSKIEHPSVYYAMKYLEEEGFEISYLENDSKGYIDLNQLKKEIREDTILVSIMHVNNEIGTIQPIAEIGEIIKKINPGTVFHVDGVQSFGKLLLMPKKWNIDLLSISAHKFHGPKGIGALYKNKKVRLKSLLYGGGQQKGLRSGTENVPGIVGLGIAAEEIYQELDDNNRHILSLKKMLWEGLSSHIDDVYLNGPDLEDGAPNIINILFKNIKGEVLLHALEDKKIYVSTGSACSSNQPHLSQTLKSLGLSDEEVQSSLRFSFSKYNTEEEVKNCIQALKDIVPILRRFKAGGR
ncbi:MAG: cysteine desulfurase [Epulopiscium sp.]|nr:cysteine desulfurase [Candidatus Epulonipiscium sp.]HOQ17330.1 cysteine desulfurase family protein [Defluviitaleaceae bacterium]HPT75388.1 cysteine desulfurase family protein [Defluviitaleaceae bacterium]